MTDFDLHVMVDWSASSSPTRGRNSIWVSVRASEPDESHLVNHPTRRAAFDHLDSLVASSPRRRILIGVDFSLGLPAGAAAMVSPDDPSWRGVWAVVTGAISDDHRNRNNRFEVGGRLNHLMGATEGPFWGRPRGRAVEGLAPTRPAAATRRVGEFREVERALRSTGRRPASVWQLAYAGSVGGQTLTGIPVLARLAATHPDRVGVWPFETGLTHVPADGRDDVVVIAEVWPSAFAVDRRAHPVLDAAQVTHVTSETVAADRRGELGAWFAPAVADPAVVLGEEGWILGIGADGSVPWPT